MGYLDDLLGTGISVGADSSPPSTREIDNSDTSTYFINPNVGDNSGFSVDPAGNSNFGSTLDYSAGAPGNTVIPQTGNSLLDSLAKISGTSVGSLTTGLGTFGSYLESGAVAALAKTFGVTGTLPQSSNTTVPLNTSGGAAATAKNNLILYAGIAALAVFVILRKG